MVILFGGLALLLHELVAASLDQGINRSLRTRADDLAILVSGRSHLPALPETGGAFAQIVDPATGRVRDVTPGGGARMLGLRQVRQAAEGPLLVDRGERARVLARP